MGDARGEREGKEEATVKAEAGREERERKRRGGVTMKVERKGGEGEEGGGGNCEGRGKKEKQ